MTAFSQSSAVYADHDQPTIAIQAFLAMRVCPALHLSAVDVGLYP
jgi:hypothetical protein